MIIPDRSNQSDKDFSGEDFVKYTFLEIDFHESVFNGAHFQDMIFDKCNLKHTEFTEAKFSNCRFVDCQLDYSDFVYTQVNESQFEACSFSHIEWRESTFSNMGFSKCTFYNATISLCVFNKALFDAVSANHISGNSKTYNIFLGSNLVIGSEDIMFMKFNYGFELTADTLFTYDKGSIKDYFLQLSLLKFTGKANSLSFIESIAEIIKKLVSTKEKSRLQKLKYLSLICKSRADENTLSVFSLHYLIFLLNNCAREIHDTALFMELVDLIMYLKTVQYNDILALEKDIVEQSGDFPATEGLVCSFELKNNYERDEVEGFLDQMAHFLDLPRGDMQLLSFRTGSTIFDLIIKSSTSIAGVLAFINFSLAQLNKTLVQVAKIRKTAQTLRGPVKAKKGKTSLSKKKALPIAIMSNEGNPYHAKMNDLLKNYGRDIAKLEGPGRIDINP